MNTPDFTTEELAMKLIAALYARGLLNHSTYANILSKYAG